MTETSIVAVGLGTCFAFGADLGGATNAGPMRTLTWLAKENRPPAEQKTGKVQHPAHPSGLPRKLLSSAAAQQYAAEIFASKWEKITDLLQLDPIRLVVVPVPSSQVTVKSPPDERWPARSMADFLSKLIGVVVSPALVNREARAGKGNKGARYRPHVIAANTVALTKIPDGAHVLLLDDIITHGERLAATHHVLMSTSDVAAVGALCIAFSNDKSVSIRDCYATRRRVIRYDPAVTPWKVSISSP